MKKQYKFITLIILSLMTILVFNDFFKIGLSNSDDSCFYTQALVGDFLSDAKIWAKDQGRFTYLFRFIFISVPYIFDNIIWQKSIQYLPVILSFILFSVIIAKIMKSDIIGYALYTLLLMFFSVPKKPFVPPIAYPFTFSADLLLFLFSAFFLIKYYETKNYFYYFSSLICFLIAFVGYEAYFIFFCFYFIIIIYNNNPKFNIKNYFKITSLKETLPLLLPVLLFYIVYFMYKINVYHLSSYPGTALAKNFDLLNFFKFIFNVNKSAYPTYIYFQTIDIIKKYNENHINNLFYILSNSSFISIIKTLTLSILFVLFLSKIFYTNYTFKNLSFFIIISLVLSYGINIILGVTDKYNQLYKLDGYVTTYFAFFGITFSIFILIILLLKIANKFLYKYTLMAIIFILTFYISSLISYANKYLSKDWSIAQKKFYLFDLILKNNEFDEIPENSIIFSPNINETESILGKNVFYNFNWNVYLYAKTKKNIFICNDKLVFEKLIKENNNAKIYLLFNYEFPEYDLYAFTISEINKLYLEENLWISDKLNLFFLNNSKKEKNWTYNLFINNQWIYVNPHLFETNKNLRDDILVEYKISKYNKISFISKNIFHNSELFSFDSLLCKSGIICDAELIDKETNVFTTKNKKYKFDGLEYLTDSIAFSGKNSIKLNKNFPFGFITILKIKKGKNTIFQ